MSGSQRFDCFELDDDAAGYEHVGYVRSDRFALVPDGERDFLLNLYASQGQFTHQGAPINILEKAMTEGIRHLEGRT